MSRPTGQPTRVCVVYQHLPHYRYGVFAGLTVYAVPQVLAATAPVGLLSVPVQFNGGGGANCHFTPGP